MMMVLVQTTDQRLQACWIFNGLMMQGIANNIKEAQIDVEEARIKLNNQELYLITPKYSQT